MTLLSLVATLLATPVMAAIDQGIVPKVSLRNKPEIVIQGNVVVDDSKNPTGFYELALCARSPRRIYGPDPAAGYAAGSERELSEAEYAQVLADIEAGTAGVGETDYTVTYYPFSAASAVVEINADVLTAVHWDVESVTYSDWDGANYADRDTDYPRGIDISANVDPEVWGATDPEPFPDVTQATLRKPRPQRVALDAEGDRSAFTVAAQVDDYSAATKTALVTLSAHTPDNKPVIYTEATPLAVIRFSYDLKRFPKSTVMANAADSDVKNHLTGTAADEGFWLGLDRGNNPVVNSGKTPLTWLANTALGTGGNSYDYSDARAAATDAGQVVWTKLSSKDTAGATIPDWTDTEYYYYLGGENPAGTGTEGSAPVSLPGSDEPVTVEHIWVPNTASEIKVLAEGTTENPLPGAGDTWSQAQYSYYANLISLNDGLRLELVNAPTFRAPRGDGGKFTILYYDYTDELIGAQVVKGGDVRQEVNSYVERNFIHPDLRASQYLNGGELPTDPTAMANYDNVVNTLDREFNYRGSKYPYKLNGGDALKVANGDDYPLTNKLDYVFYKRMNIVNTLRTPDPADPTNTDKDTVENYYTVVKPNADAETGKYPYIYGWAIVEDPANTKIEVAGENWEVLKDSVKTENTWTTFGAGELRTEAPDYTDRGSPAQAFPMGTVETQPGGLGAALTSPVHYDYMTSSAGDNGYLRFADFSDFDALLKPGQDVLIVKAVYEPGTELLPEEFYTVVENSLYVTRYGNNASTQDSTFAFQYQYQRATDLYGDWQGVKRTRDPALQAGLTYDVNAYDTEDKDLNPSKDAKRFYVEMLAKNQDVMDIDLTAGGVIWRVDYVLLDLYGGFDIATGVKRSGGGELELKNNFKYEKLDDSGDSIPYEERQGTDGFVTQGTLHQLMEVATANARGDTSTRLLSAFSIDTVEDLNLRPKEGSEFSIFDYGLCADYTQNLVDAIVAAYPDPATAPAGIYNKKGNVELSWHQLQRHIVMCNAGNANGIFDGTSLMSDSDCAGFTWCRMDNCAGDIKMDINTAGDVLTALYLIQNNAPTSNEYKKAYEALYGNGTTTTGVTTAFLKGFGYRIQADGVPYDYDPTITDTALKTAILDDLDDVVTALTPSMGPEPDWSTVTWGEVQEEIIRSNMGADTPDTLNIWWEPSDGKPYGTPPTPTTWADVLRYSYLEYVGVDMDGDGVPDAKVAHAFENFNGTNVTPAQLDWMIGGHVEGQDTGDYADMGWLRKELDSNDEAVKFADADEFRAAWLPALEALAKPKGDNGGGYDSPDKLKLAKWAELQYAVLTGTYKSYADVMAETGGKAEGPLKGKELYWNDGGEPTAKLEDLLAALSTYISGDDTQLNDLLKDGIGVINNDFHLRKSAPMGQFDSVDEFKAVAFDAILALYSSSNGLDFLGDDGQTLTMEWEELQWLLLNYKTMTTQPTKAEILADPSNDYWWKDGGSPSKPMEIRTIHDLITAALWVKEPDGFPAALDKLTAQTLTDLGIWGDERGLPFPATLTDAQAIQMVKDATADFPYLSATVGSEDAAALSKELQYAIFNANAYLPATSISDDYWWQGTGGPAITDQESLLKAAWLYYVGDGAGTTTDRALDELPTDVSFVNDRTTGLAMRSDSEGTAFADMDAFMSLVEAVVKSGLTYDQAIGMTNYQLQYMLLGGEYKSDEDVKAEVIDTTDPANPVDNYWWFTNDTKPGKPGRTELMVDPAVWSDFMQSVGGYFELWDASGFTFSPLDDKVIRDTLLLRANDDGTEIRSADFYAADPAAGDMLMATMDAIFACSNGGDYIDLDSYAMKQELSWYQFQYCLIHRDNLDRVPTDAEAKAVCEAKWDWKYTEGGGGGGGEDPDPPTPPTPPTPTRTEKKVDAAVWNDFITSAGAYFELFDGSAFTFSPFNDDVVRDSLLLRKDDAGTELTAGELFCGDPSGGDLIMDTLNAIFGCSNGGSYIDPDSFAVIQAPTWYQFQYALIHRGDLTELPDDATCQTECQTKWDWKYTGGGGGGGEDPDPPTPPTPSTKTEIPVDAGTWSSFIQSAGAYFELFDGSAFTFDLDNDIVKDTLLLRKDDAGTVITAGELFSGDASAGDLIMDTLNAIFGASNGGSYIDPDSFAVIQAPTWYQFQYALIHRDSLTTLPDDAACKAECEEKWGWKYTGGSGGGGGGGEEPDPPTPSKTEIIVDATAWNDFITSAGAYFELFDASEFTFALDNDIVKDTLLLRGDDAGTVITAGELFSGDPGGGDLIMDTLNAIFGASNGGNYIDPDNFAMVQAPTWYQFQYALIHRGNLTTLPDDAACKAECEAKWSWKYTTG